jgi:hypothetical protein
MTVDALLQNTSQAQQKELLREILAQAFETVDNEINLDHEQGSELGKFFRDKTKELAATAEKNLRILQILGEIPDGVLDDAIHEEFQGVASDLNNRGSDHQVKHLVIQASWPLEAIQRLNTSSHLGL